MKTLMQSKAFELSSEDLKRWGLAVMTFVLIPSIAYIIDILQTGALIDWRLFGAMILGAVLDLIKRFVTDHTTPL